MDDSNLVIASGCSNPGDSQDQGIPQDLIHGDPWFEDGNLILAADKHIFRIHRGVLARQSEVFHGMLEVPQPPPSTGPTPDMVVLYGCQVIPMYDKPVELSNFLKAIYDGVYVFSHLPREFFFIMGSL